MRYLSTCFAVIAPILFGLIMLSGCSSTTWEDAQQADTYESYQSYINDNPDGNHMEEAYARADSSYWSSIKNDTTAAPFENYLSKFPGGDFRSQAQTKIYEIAPKATKARVTGSNVIIRSEHTTASRSAGVVSKKGTVVQILDEFNSGNGDEALLKKDVKIDVHGKRISLAKGKAIRILDDRSDSVHASFSTSAFGRTEAIISKDAIEAMGGERWYKIHTKDGITGWIYGKFIEEL